MEAITKHRTLLLWAVGLGASVAVTWLLLSRRRKKRQLRRVGEVSQLFLYPVKSCRGIPLQEAECREYGLKNGELRDRHWLVVKEDKVHVTARQEPRMVLITATCGKGHLTLSAPEMDDLQIPLKLPTTNDIFTCKVHGNEVQGRDCGDEASDWMTSFLKSSQTYRMVYFEDQMKPRNPINEYPLYNENDQSCNHNSTTFLMTVSQVLAYHGGSPWGCSKVLRERKGAFKVAYPDLAPFLLLSESSLANLNTKLEKKVTIRNFRPNIVIFGCDAFAEDTWKDIQIGKEVILRRVMPCPRCILTTVDPDTGIIDMKEPLNTLRSYRLCDMKDKEVFKSSPLFGQFLKPLKRCIVRVGDPVYQITY